MTTGWAKRNAAATRLAAALLAGCGALALSACEQRAEPRPAYEAAPPPPPAPLAGAPDAAPTAAAPPAAEAQPGMEAAPSLAPPEGAPPQALFPAPNEGLVAMAPIPNPEDGGPVPPGSTRRYGHPAYSTRPHARVRVLRRRPHARMAAAMRPVPSRPAPSRPAPTRPGTGRAAPHASAPAPRPHPAPPVKPVAKPATPLHAAPVAAPKSTPNAKAAPHHERRATPSELRQARRGHTDATSNTTASNTTGADAGARTEALRAALSTAVARSAVLSAPKAAADQAADVTLTLPAGFYDTVKTEAGRQAMGDAAASANADATLTGEGYAIIPGGAQSQPLRAGQPTAFHWTVTAPAGAKGPLRADVSVDLLGGGSQTLALGAVDQASAGGGAPRWWGAALLAAVVALGLGWLARTRSVDARIAASRKRAKRPDGTVNGQRPLDLRPDDSERLR